MDKPIAENIQAGPVSLSETTIGGGDVRYYRKAEVDALLIDLQARLAEAEAKLLVPGVVYCPKCNFEWSGADENTTEPCPNGCGPLWPRTWEQYALEAIDIRDRFIRKYIEAANMAAESLENLRLK